MPCFGGARREGDQKGEGTDQFEHGPACMGKDNGSKMLGSKKLELLINESFGIDECTVKQLKEYDYKKLIE